ncbi:restriction endonuclease subunit S [Salmonella enterica subsp. enterica serovar Redba]|nr:restriction endonuclease subunit S [Salmonella enterica subsp. enterica serovar Redba]ELB6605071.1 restriction endonuclease subunit S [Salmonella enterica]
MSFNSTPKELIEQNINGLLSIHDSWQRIPMDAIAKITNGFAFKSSEFNTKKDGLPLIRIRDVLKGNTSTYYSGTVPEGYWVNPEDLIVGMDGDFNTTIWHSEPALLNQRVCKIDIDEWKYSKRFFFHTLPGYLSAINANTSSVTVKHLSSRTLQETLLPLPPLAEQKIIAEKLDTLLAQVDSTKARLEQIPQILKRFRQAVLAMALNGSSEQSRNPTKIVKLIDVTKKITDGEHLTPKTINSGIPLLSAKDVQEDELLFDNVKYLSDIVAAKALNRCNPEKNDILIVSRGATVGRTHLVSTSKTFCLMGSVLLIKLDTEQVVPEYMKLIFNDISGQQQLVSASGATAQQAIYIRDVKKFSFKLISLHEQHEIVRRVEQLFAWADTIEKQVNSALTRVNSLTQSILAKAFRGELTAQWRAENPSLISGENSAAALLEKIKAERAASGGKKTSRKKS